MYNLDITKTKRPTFNENEETVPSASEVIEKSQKMSEGALGEYGRPIPHQVKKERDKKK